MGRFPINKHSGPCSQTQRVALRHGCKPSHRSVLPNRLAIKESLICLCSPSCTWRKLGICRPYRMVKPVGSVFETYRIEANPPRLPFSRGSAREVFKHSTSPGTSPKPISGVYLYIHGQTTGEAYIHYAYASRWALAPLAVVFPGIEKRAARGCR